MITHTFNRNREWRTQSARTRTVLMLASASVFAISAPAFAQDAQVPTPAAQDAPLPDAANQEDGGDIVVTGVRASLSSALSTKRDATEFVDALVAEDIAKFPDSNLGEALQRIPGITVEPNAGGDLGSSVGEGGTINVRGLQANFTQVRVNGLIATNPGTERGFSFNVLGSDLISSAVVRKTLTAKDDEGGLAGTVDLKTYHPLEYRDRILSVTVRGNYADQSEKLNPAATVIFADQFADGRFGIAAGISYDYRDIVENRQGHGFTPLINSIGGNASKLTPTQRDIANATLIPLDPAVFLNTQARHRLNATLSLQAIPIDGLKLSFDSIYAKLNSKGNNIRLDFPIEGAPATLVPVDLTRDGDVFRSGTFPASSQFMRIIDNQIERRQEVYQGALSADWEVDPTLTVHTQLGYSNAVEDFSRWNQIDLRSAFTNIFYTFDGTGVTATPALGDKTNPALYTELNRIRDRPSYDSDRQHSADLDFIWKVGLGPITSIEFGGGYRDRTKSFRSYDGRAAGLPSSSVANLSSFLNYRPIDISGDAAQVAPGVIQVVNRDQLIGQVAPNGYAVPEVLSAHYDITEEVAFSYALARFAIGGLSGNAGIRFVRTDQTSIGYQVVGGATLPARFTNRYAYALPSVQLRYDLTPTLVARASLFKSLTRPELANIQTGRRVDTFNGGSGTAGNTELNPFTALNYDAGIEWYFGRDALVSGSYFRKELSGFVETLTERVTLTDPVGTPYTIFLTRPINGNPAVIQGVELSAQAPFRFLTGSLRNTGMLLNATYTDASGKFAAGDTRNRALPFVSKYSFNVIGYYDAEPFSLRLAYAWRDRYVTGSSVGSIATSREPYGQLDLSSTYTLRRNLSATANVQNLTNRQDITSVNLRPDLQAGVRQVGRRYSLSATYKF
ncbi:TonB-dependent receptor [Sphingomonas xinjiangensis]|uniref:TonB-dependent receptor n=1 Tax=Sphingomonas xinjiangensis TaxID=643568 RepID=A0A840YQV7_9SPHN|nr:TonB-dependent receptor [Sphingomonas xinjiangensis]MBB5711611.1 TonB-dependent receptor [Sphingomonas xinjiangensis]